MKRALVSIVLFVVVINITLGRERQQIHSIVKLGVNKEQVRFLVKKDQQVGVYVEFRWVFKDSLPAELLAVFEKDEQLHRFVKDIVVKGQKILPNDLRGHQEWHLRYTDDGSSPLQVVFSYLNGGRKEIWFNIYFSFSTESFLKPANETRSFNYGHLAFSWNEKALLAKDITWAGVLVDGGQRSEKFTVCLAQSARPQRNQLLFNPDRSLFFRNVRDKQLKISGVQMDLDVCCTNEDQASAVEIGSNRTYGSVTYCLSGARSQKNVDGVRRSLKVLQWPVFLWAEMQESPQDGALKEGDWRPICVILELDDD